MTKVEKDLNLIQQSESEKHDQQVKSRTARYDLELKLRARKLAINPDNFATEQELEATINKLENK